MLIKSIFDGYPQTWADVCKLKKFPFIGAWLYKFAQWFCGKLTGHVNSKTEWGYSGGEFADVWCRWCNKMGEIPVKEIDNHKQGARTIIWRQTGCDIRHEPWEPKK